VIKAIHKQYYEAGADICETNTFSGTWIAQHDYGCEEFVYEMNKVAAQICKEAATEVEQKDGKRRLVAGAIGPTNRTASMSRKVDDPAFRDISFDQVSIQQLCLSDQLCHCLISILYWVKTIR
jgi:5-methyltetrahydrofolate--homocysteine methyltransferase